MHAPGLELLSSPVWFYDSRFCSNVWGNKVRRLRGRGNRAGRDGHHLGQGATQRTRATAVYTPGSKQPLNMAPLNAAASPPGARSQAALQLFGSDAKSFSAPQLEQLASATQAQLSRWKATNERLRDEVEVRRAADSLGGRRCQRAGQAHPPYQSRVITSRG